MKTLKTLRTLGFAALVAVLLLPASVLMAQPPDGPGGVRGGFGEGPGEGPGGDREFPFRQFVFERMAQELDLSEGQKAEIEALREGHRDEVEPLIEKARAARHAVGDLMRSESFDEATIRSAAQQAADVQVELTVLRARHHTELRSLLTAEQQEKAAELRQQWKERAEQFRGRRDRGFGGRSGRGFDRGPGGRIGGGPGRW